MLEVHTTDSCFILMPAGPLPEPVVNGGMEEKVRCTTSKYTHHTQRDTDREMGGGVQCDTENSAALPFGLEMCFRAKPELRRVEELSVSHSGHFPPHRRSLSFLAERRTIIVQPSALNRLQLLVWRRLKPSRPRSNSVSK